MAPVIYKKREVAKWNSLGSTEFGRNRFQHQISKSVLVENIPASQIPQITQKSTQKIKNRDENIQKKWLRDESIDTLLSSPFPSKTQLTQKFSSHFFPDEDSIDSANNTPQFHVLVENQKSKHTSVIN